MPNAREDLWGDKEKPKVATFRGINITGLDFTGGVIKNIKFINCHINLNLSSSNLDNVVFQDSFISIKFNYDW